MLFNFLITVVALAWIVAGAPTVEKQRRAPTNVPSYVLDYGEEISELHSLHPNPSYVKRTSAECSQKFSPMNLATIHLKIILCLVISLYEAQQNISTIAVLVSIYFQDARRSVSLVQYTKVERITNINSSSTAPLVYLYSGETYFPADLSAQLANTQPEVNYVVVSRAPSLLTLNNLNELNSYGSVYLTSKVDITTNPAWLNGIKPDTSGKTNNAISCAIIVNDHGSGNVDAFYMYFYAFNWGGVVLGQQLGMILFE